MIVAVYYVTSGFTESVTSSVRQAYALGRAVKYLLQSMIYTHSVSLTVHVLLLHPLVFLGPPTAVYTAVRGLRNREILRGSDDSQRSLRLRRDNSSPRDMSSSPRGQSSHGHSSFYKRSRTSTRGRNSFPPPSTTTSRPTWTTLAGVVFGFI